MKKNVITVLLCMLTFALLLAYKPNTIRAFAANDFVVTVQEIETSFTINGENIYAGDLKVTISLTNNMGFVGIGFACPYTVSALDGVCYSNSSHSPVVIRGSLINGLSSFFDFNLNDGLFSIAISSIDVVTEDGDIVSFFLRPHPNVSIEPDNIQNLIAPLDFDEFDDGEDEYSTNYTVPEEFEYTVAIPYSFYLGDIDGTVSNNGYRIGLLDVQKLLQMINSYDGTLYVTATDTNFSQTDYPGLYVMINNVPTLELRVADVNFDGIIDSTDHALLLDYYVSCIIGLEPEGEIGQLQTHVTYVVQYSTGS